MPCHRRHRGADEAGAVLVTAVVTAAVQVAEVVGRADAAPLDVVAPAPWVGPLRAGRRRARTR